MLSITLISFVMLCFLLNYSGCTNYCSPIFCKHSKTHVMCKFKESAPSYNCFKYERLIKTNKDKRDVLHKLNSRRNRVASGEIRSLGAAENMQRFMWNDELEAFAQRWADQCVKSSLYHESDSCRDLENISVGQSIATVYGEAPGLTASSLVDLWYMELLNVNASILYRYMPTENYFGMQHFDYFTQLVWADTSEVGCAGVKFKEVNMGSPLEGNKTVHRLVCNFAPSGNRIRESVFISGNTPCSRCPLGSYCDSQYEFLCAPTSSTEKYTKANIIDLKAINTLKADNINFSIKHNIMKNVNNTSVEPDSTGDNDTQFDFFSHLYDFTKKSVIEKESTTKCKEVLAVDEFVELLKSRLKTDQILKDLLFSSTKSLTTEAIYSDRTMAAIINEIYSKKETSTIKTTTESNDINSTILADLVEAVIFRHSDVYTTVEDERREITDLSKISPVKIQAKLADVNVNMEFTGHYFFPEEEEQIENKKTDMYYDTENIPISEIEQEIEDLKRNRATKSFLDEILDSDITERMIANTFLPSENNDNGKYIINAINSQTISKMQKRAVKIHKNNLRRKKGGFFISYKEFLRRIADDLRNLKLNERFYCAHNFVESLSSHIFFTLGVFFYFVFIL